MGLFSHGEMNDPSVAFRTFMIHARLAAVVIEDEPLRFRGADNNDFNVLELGPGDSPFSAAFASALGATRTWLVDAGRFAAETSSAYAALQQFLGSAAGVSKPNLDVPPVASLPALLEACNAVYLTDGVKSFEGIADGSIDYCFSNAVLEHVRVAEFADLARHLFRIIKPNGVAVHRVDLRDHIGGALNNLRFSRRTWESALFSSSGFYTNRIGMREMVDMFERAGFACEMPTVLRWSTLPTPRKTMDKEFRQRPEDDLLVYAFDLINRKVT